MMRKNVTLFLLVFFISVILMSCHQGVGCPADQYNNWKQIEANRKKQQKSPGNPNKTPGKQKVTGNGIVPQ